MFLSKFACCFAATQTTSVGELGVPLTNALDQHVVPIMEPIMGKTSVLRPIKSEIIPDAFGPASRQGSASSLVTVDLSTPPVSPRIRKSPSDLSSASKALPGPESKLGVAVTPKDSMDARIPLARSESDKELGFEDPIPVLTAKEIAELTKESPITLAETRFNSMFDIKSKEPSRILPSLAEFPPFSSGYFKQLQEASNVWPQRLRASNEVEKEAFKLLFKSRTPEHFDALYKKPYLSHKDFQDVFENEIRWKTALNSLSGSKDPIDVQKIYNARIDYYWKHNPTAGKA